jgi:hypothetical protein
MQPKSNEQYWRDRYGMPPRVDERSATRTIAVPRRRSRNLGALLRYRVPFRLPPMAANRKRFAISSALKIVGLIGFAIFVASNAIIHPLPDVAPKAAHASAPILMEAGPGKGAVTGATNLATFSAAQETSLVALRGYLLTGSTGFKAEWLQAGMTADAMQTAIDQDSRGWSDGQRLMRLSEMRKATSALRNEEKMLVSIIATPNQYPGLRLYREDVDPALTQSLGLLDEAVQAALTAGAAANDIDALARVRGDVRELRRRLAVYLPSADTTLSEQLQTTLTDVRGAPTTLAALRIRTVPSDRERIVKLTALLRASDAKLQQIFALKQSPRWDYADYSFKHKVLPLAEKILKLAGELKTDS